MDSNASGGDADRSAPVSLSLIVTIHGDRFMRIKIIAISVAVATAAIGGAGARAMQAPELFDVPAAKASMPMPANVDGMLREKSARWAARVSVNKRALIEGEREIMLSLPEGPRLRISRAKSYRMANGAMVWSGASRLTADGRIKLDGQAPATALFVVRGERVTGQVISSAGDVYEVVTSEDGGQQVLVKRNPASLESEADDTPARVDIPTQPESRITTRATTRAGETIVRVMQVYTPEAVAELGGQNGANDRAAFFIAQSNTAFTNNGLSLLFESAGVFFTPQGQATDASSTLLSRIQGTNDGWFDVYSTTERTNTGADLVALVVRDGLNASGALLCGQAAAIGAVASSGFFVQNQSCTTFTFVHEAAHLFGARHDNDPTTRPFRYGHGYVNSSRNFRTIMAVNSNPQPRIGYFSTIDQTFNGGTMGTSRNNDNERVMRERAATMAAFR
jgi:peptidyl-Asp metalloendopeptidase